jgi:hypothetical protein
MRSQTRAYIVLGILSLGVSLSAGCFGPFKKKSSGGGGGGGSSSVEDPTSETDPTSKTTSDKDKETAPPAGAKTGYGCLQGVIIDGFTGQPVELSAPDKIFVLIRGTKIAASKVDDANLIGQYYICNIPLDESYSVFAFVDSYQNFEGTVNIASTVGNRTGAGNAITTDIVKKDPVVISNIVLFPKTAGGRDLTIRVYNQGTIVEGAMVDLEPINASSNNFSVNGAALAYSNGTRNFPQRLTTDADGKAVFTADKISLGTNYQIRVTPPAALNVTIPAVQTITLGIGGAAVDDNNNYVLNYEVTDSNQALRIIACSTQAESFNVAGRVMVVFNRDIELSRNDNSWIATEAGGITAALVANNAGNLAAETMTATISGGNMLILTPVWGSGTSPKTPDYEKADADIQNDDLNTVVTYPAADIKVKSASEQKDAWTALNAGSLNPGGIACSFNTRIFKARE